MLAPHPESVWDDKKKMFGVYDDPARIRKAANDHRLLVDSITVVRAVDPDFYSRRRTRK